MVFSWALRAPLATCLSAVTVCAALCGAGCGGKGRERQPSLPSTGKGAVSALQVFLSSSNRALAEGDLEVATLEIRGALDLASQRQAASTTPVSTEVESLVASSKRHVAAAEAHAKGKRWSVAKSHYETADTLLRKAADRWSQRVTEEVNRFNGAYVGELEKLKEAYDRERESKSPRGEALQALNREYEAKEEKLKAEWEPRRQAFDKQVERMRREAQENRDALTAQRCELYPPLATVCRALGLNAEADRHEALAHQEMAGVYERRQAYAEAEAEYREWDQVHPNTTQPRLGLARVLEQQGRLAEAAEQFRALVADDPANVALHAQLAQVLGRGESWEQSAQEWQSLIGKMQGKLAEVTGESALAEDARAQLRAKLSEYQFQLGEACRQAGHKDKALAAYKAAINLDPALADLVPKEYREAPPEPES